MKHMSKMCGLRERHSISLGLFLLLLANAAVIADDWPEFRGPGGSGLASEGQFPTEWSDSRNIAWKQAIPGAGWSSPAIRAGRIYLTAAVPAGGDQSLQSLCLDAATGKVLWQREIFQQKGSAAVHTKNSHASPTPVVADRRLYVHFGHEGTACLDLEGNVVWRNTSLKYEPWHGNGGSPILVADRLIFSVDGSDQQFVTGLDAHTGKVAWKTDRNADASSKFSFSTPLAITVNGRKQVISAGSNVVSSHDPATGAELWQVRYDGYSVVPRPIFGHGLIYLSTGYTDPKLLAIRPDGRGDVSDTHVTWQTTRNVPLTPSPLLVGNELYMMSDSGIASCLDAQTGRMHWQKRIGGNHSASPICAGGNIYFLDEEGNATVIKAGTQFEQVAKNSIGERTLASFAVSDGAIFIRTDKHIYRIQGG